MKGNRVLDPMLKHISTNSKQLKKKNDSKNDYNLTLKMIQIFISILLS